MPQVGKPDYAADVYCHQKHRPRWLSTIQVRARQSLLLGDLGHDRNFFCGRQAAEDGLGLGPLDKSLAMRLKGDILRQSISRKKPRLGGIVARAQLAADDMSRIQDEHAARTCLVEERVYIQEIVQGNADPCFLERLSNGRLLGAFPGLGIARRQGPFP
jgi:hypothetical protein